MAPTGPGGRWRGRDERGWLVVPPPSLRFRRLPQAPVCELHTDGREDKVGLSPPPSVLLGDSGPPCHGLRESPTGWEREGVARGLAVRDGRSEHPAVLQAQRSWAGGSRGLGTRVALGPMAWRGRMSSSLSCPGWCSCGSEGCSIPALETENQLAPCPQPRSVGTLGPSESLQNLCGFCPHQHFCKGQHPVCLPRPASPGFCVSSQAGMLPDTHSRSMCMAMCVCLHICTCICACECVSMYACTSVCAYVSMFTCMSMCACVSTCVHVSVCTCLWVCMRVHVLHLPRGSVGGSSAESPHFYLLLCSTTHNGRLKEVRGLRRAFLRIPDVGGWPGYLQGLRERRGSWPAA